MMRKQVEEMKTYDELKRHKIELQLECLKLEKCKMSLELMDLEWTLGVTPSETTSQYHQNQSKVLILDSDNIMIGNVYITLQNKQNGNIER
jgi:hypothetical protein